MIANINGPEGTMFPVARNMSEGKDIQFSLKKQNPLTMKQGNKKNQTFHIPYPTGKNLLAKKTSTKQKCFQLKPKIKISDLS